MVRTSLSLSLSLFVKIGQSRHGQFFLILLKHCILALMHAILDDHLFPDEAFIIICICR